MFQIKNLDWHEILEKIKSFATSESARHAASQIKPLASAEKATQSFYEALSASEIILSGVRPHMQSLDLYDLWITRLRKKAFLKTLELKDIRTFCLEVIALKEALKISTSAWAFEQSENLMSGEEPLSAIDNLMTPSGDIRMDASEKLYRLSKEKDSLARQIQNQMDRIVKDQQIEHMLQDKFVTTREGRWVIPVKGGMQHFVAGVIHGSSQTKQTVFIEPEVVIPLNNRLRQIEVDIEDEVERLLQEISDYMATQVSGFEKSKNILETCDLTFAKAQLTIALEARPCEFKNDTLILRDLIHPLLKLSGKKAISNTVQLTEQKGILILSGPNAGGKTVLLKAIGLAAQMARCGLPICCGPESILPFFKEVVTGIGDSQSVDENLSTFAAHLNILDQASQLSGRDNLILIDEICGSTDPEEGSALARAFIEKYAEQKVFAVITSHLSPLKMGWKETDPILNGSLEYNTEKGVPTYQYLQGIPGESLALQTARRVGVSKTIIESAVEKLSPLAKARQNQLVEMEQLKKEIGHLQDSLKKQITEAQKKKAEFEKKIDDFEKEKENKLSHALKKANTKVDDAIATVKASQVLDKHRQLQQIKFELPEIVTAKPSTNTGGNLTLQSAEEFAQRFPTGSKVFVTNLNQDGVVQSSPNAKGEVMVLSQSIRLQLHWTELKPPQKSMNPTSQLARKSGQVNVSFVDSDRTLDLRGKTVDTALSELEIALDKATQMQEDRMKIIHGHGTESLKKAIRTYLSRSVYVRKWKAGNNETGGDGITWVEMGSN